MTKEKVITPNTMEMINNAQPKELSAVTKEVFGANTVLNQANDELDLLEDALKQFEYTKDMYDRRSVEVRNRMQRIVTKL